jgi:hypothetical protein
VEHRTRATRLQPGAADSAHVAAPRNAHAVSSGPPPALPPAVPPVPCTDAGAASQAVLGRRTRRRPAASSAAAARPRSPARSAAAAARAAASSASALCSSSARAAAAAPRASAAASRSPAAASAAAAASARCCAAAARSASVSCAAAEFYVALTYRLRLYIIKCRHCHPHHDQWKESNKQDSSKCLTRRSYGVQWSPPLWVRSKGMLVRSARLRKAAAKRHSQGRVRPRVGRACCAARQRASAAAAPADASPAAASASDARASAAASTSAAAAAAPAAAADAASALLAACDPHRYASCHRFTRRSDDAPGAQQARGRPCATRHAVRFVT